MKINQILTEAAEDRKRNAMWAQITSYEKRAKETKNDIKRDHLMKMASELRAKLPTTDEEKLAESLAALEEAIAGDIGAQIKAVYKKIYDAGDDAVEFAYYDSPIFAQYWDEYEGDLDSIIAEVDPSELQIILDELTAAAANQEDDEDDYYSLPMPNGDRDEVDEGGDAFMPGIQNTPEYKAGFETGKLPVPHPEGTQEYASYYKGVIDKATPNLQKTAEGNDKVGNMDADKFDAAMDRLKKLAGASPLKTVYDPQKRVYKNVPVAVQPKK